MNIVNALGSKGAPVGFKPTGSLMPVKNGCADSATGPPVAPRALRLPARRSRVCAVNSASSNSTIACVSLLGQMHEPPRVALVASLAWCAQVLNDRRGRGRLAAVPHHRAQESEVRRGQRTTVRRYGGRGALQPYGSSTLSRMNSAFGGTSSPTRMRPRDEQQAERLPALATVPMSASSQLDPSLVAEDRIEAARSDEARCTSSGVIVQPWSGR